MSPGTVGPDRNADRWEIHDLYTRYCDGVDRVDAATLLDVFHPDAVIDKGEGERWEPVRRDDYVPAIIARQSSYLQVSHQVTAVRIDFVGDDRAVTEARCSSAERRPVAGGVADHLFRLRYVDLLERRDDRVWRSARRRMIIDHAMVSTADPASVATLLGGRFLGGRTRESDAGEQLRRALLLELASL